jgi:hypothetical protein
VAAQIRKLRQRFRLQQAVMVGDRGMLTSARIREDLETEQGVRWITALKAPQIQQLAADGKLQLSLFDQQDLAEIQHPAYPGERLIACRNPLLAEERQRKREEFAPRHGETVGKDSRRHATPAPAAARQKRDRSGGRQGAGPLQNGEASAVNHRRGWLRLTGGADFN